MNLSEQMLFSLPEASQVTSLSEATLRRAINNGQLIGVRIGTAVRIRKNDLDNWISSLEQVSRSPFSS